MVSKQRQREIIELVTARDGCSVAELAGELDVSKATIRRDLDELDRENLVDRTHGGAIPVVDRVAKYDNRTVRNREAKRAIADRAVEEVHEEGIVAFASGSTVLEVSKRVPADLSFAALTNHPPVAYELARGEAEVRLCGGTFELEHQALLGPIAQRTIERNHFDVAFFSTEGISAEDGLTTAYDSAARVKELLIANSRRTVLLADRSKFDTTSAVQFCEFSDVDLLITDGSVPDDLRELLVEGGVDVVENLR